MISALLASSRARSVAPPIEVIPPPINGVVDDVNNTFDFTLATGYDNLSDYEFTTTNALTWSIVTNKPIYVGNKDLGTAYVSVRTIDRAKEKYSVELYNEIPYTYIEPVKSTVAAPTGVTGNATDRTFTFTVASGLTLDDYEFCYSYDYSRVWRDVTANPFPLNVAWALASNEVAIRVKETSTRWASKPSFVSTVYPERTPTVEAPTLIIDQSLRIIDFRHPLGMWARDNGAISYIRVGTRIGNNAWHNVRPPIQVPNDSSAIASNWDFRFNNGRYTNAASNGIANSPAFPIIITTPPAPKLTTNNVGNTISAWHPLGNSEILVSINSGSYVAYTGEISVGNVARAIGYYKFKTKSATNRLESSVVNSPAFTVDTTGEIFPYTLTLELS